MATEQTDESTPQRSLRLWPGVIVVIMQWVARFVVPVVLPEASPYGIMGALAGGLLIVVWWLFLSRAPWSERLVAVVLIAVALATTPYILHESIATGAMGMLFYILVVPLLCLAFVAWAVVSRRLAAGARWTAMAAAILLPCAAWALIRTGGFSGDFENDFAWRWSATPEERLLTRAGDEPRAPAPVAAETAGKMEPEWPGFRGPGRDGVVRGVEIGTDWPTSPPALLWRRPIGPGWSSFAVLGDLVYTQEQRGDDEVVSCYDAASGEPVWRHGDPARFWESNGGAGPRGTPTVSDGRVVTFGATGILNVLDAYDGSLVWSRNAATDTGTETPIWGFSSSPLVTGDLVVVAAAGGLAAYDFTTGEPRWVGPDGPEGESYSSPHLATVDGVEQILLQGADGLISVAPADGKLLWEHPWKGYPVVQPALTADGDILASASEQSGMRRLAVARGPGGWAVEERWTSTRLKPYYGDYVVHEGHAYGFDGSILACLDLSGGERRWKGGRYGAGQLVLLADQDLLLVLAEDGELALVRATPDEFAEVARMPAIESKTWNHPVVAGDLLLVRNAEEMAAFRLPLAEG